MNLKSEEMSCVSKFFLYHDEAKYVPNHCEFLTLCIATVHCSVNMVLLEGEGEHGLAAASKQVAAGKSSPQ